MDRLDGSGSPAAPPLDEVEALLTSSIFQPHWYAAQIDGYFRSHRSAAEHFVREGMSRLCSPHPLLMPQIWPSDLRDAWRRGEVTTFLQCLRASPDMQPPLGPLFYPQRLAADATLVSEQPGGSLGHFLSTANDEDELPTPLVKARLGDVRATWKPTIERLKRHNRLSRRRTTPIWQKEREHSWLSSLPSHREWPGIAESPQFTIVMPAWNRAEMIARAVQSVLAQTCPSWELIIVDDGSEDDTAAIAESFAATDARITVIRGEHRGVSEARNAGLAGARGSLVAFLDTDNIWLPEYLETMARGMRSSGALAAYAGIKIRGGTDVTYRVFDGDLDHLLVLNHIDLNVLVVDREIAQDLKFDVELRRWVDHDFAIRVAHRTDLHFMPFIACVYDTQNRVQNRISTREPDAWQWVVLGKHLIDWEAAAHVERHRGRVSVIIPTYQDWKLTQRAVSSVLAHTEEHDFEIILIDNGSRALIGSTLEQLFASDERVRYHRLPRNMNFGLGSNYGVTLATGEYVCFLNNDSEVRPGWMDALVQHLDRPEVRGVQPLLLYPDESIETAGTVFVARDAIPCHFLTGLPPEDAASAAGEQFSAVTAACLVMRTADVIAVKGFDPHYVNGMEDVDLCLRSIESLGGWFVVDPTVRVTHHNSDTPGRHRSRSENRRLLRQRWTGRWPALDTQKFAKAGLQIAALGGDVDWVPLPQPTIVRKPQARRLRWGIRYASTGGERGNRWGDTFYAESLATALREQGQEVVTYRHGANTRVQDSLDDVNLVLRGLDTVPPIPGAVNILWVISHPTKVTVPELEAFDLVYAASLEWSRMMSTTVGRPVLPMLQATDTRIFHPPPDVSQPRRRPPTFVGSNFKRRSRQIVTDLLAQKIDFRVIGAGWEDLPDWIWESAWVDNATLGDVYREASIVLADHWPDMAELGFLQNRVFDAVACATPVIVDSAAGIAETFGSLVQTYNNPQDLRLLFEPGSESVFGTPEERRQQADNVVARHSFDARAAELIEVVRSHRTEPGRRIQGPGGDRGN